MDYMNFLYNNLSQKNVARQAKKDTKKEEGATAEQNQMGLNQQNESNTNLLGGVTFSSTEKAREEDTNKNIEQAFSLNENNVSNNNMLANLLKTLAKNLNVQQPVEEKEVVVEDKVEEKPVEAEVKDLVLEEPKDEMNFFNVVSPTKDIPLKEVADEAPKAEETNSSNLFASTSMKSLLSSLSAANSVSKDEASTTKDTEFWSSENNTDYQTYSNTTYRKVYDESDNVYLHVYDVGGEQRVVYEDINGNPVTGKYSSGFDKYGNTQIVKDDENGLMYKDGVLFTGLMDGVGYQDGVKVEDPYVNLVKPQTYVSGSFTRLVRWTDEGAEYGYLLNGSQLTKVVDEQMANELGTANSTFYRYQDADGEMRYIKADTVERLEWGVEDTCSCTVETYGRVGSDDVIVDSETIVIKPIIDPQPIMKPFTTTTDILPDGSTVETTKYNDGSWSKVTTDVNGNVTGQEGMVIVDAGSSLSSQMLTWGSNWLPVNVEIKNPNNENAEVTYSIDANGNATINASGLEFNAEKDEWSIITYYDMNDVIDVSIDEQIEVKEYDDGTREVHHIKETPLNNITFVGDNNVITGSDKNDNITVKGNNNKVDLGAGDDNATVRGDSNKVNMGAGDDNLVIRGDNNSMSGAETIVTQTWLAPAGEKGSKEWVLKLLGSDMEILNPQYDDDGRLVAFEEGYYTAVGKAGFSLMYETLTTGKKFTIEYSDWGTDIKSTCPDESKSNWGGTITTTKSFDLNDNCYYESTLVTDKAGNTVSSHQIYDGGAWETDTQNTFDKNGNLLTSVQQQFVDGKLQSTYVDEATYDENGRMLSMDSTNLDAEGNQTWRTFSEMTYFADGKMATSAYTNWGVEDEILNKGVSEYYENGNVKNITESRYQGDVKTKETFSEYDKDGAFVKITGEVNIPSGQGQFVEGLHIVNYGDSVNTATYTYTADGHLELNANNMDISQYNRMKWYTNTNDLADVEMQVKADENSLATEVGDNCVVISPRFWAPAMENVTINGNGNNITGGKGNDNITVKGNNNVIDLGDGEDTVNVIGNNNTLKNVENVDMNMAEPLNLNKIGVAELFSILGGAEGVASELLLKADCGSGAAGGRYGKDNQYLISADDLRAAFGKYSADTPEGQVVRLFFDGNSTTALFNDLAKIGWAWGGSSNDYIDFGEIVDGLGVDRSKVNTATLSYDTMKAKLESLTEPVIQPGEVGSIEYTTKLMGFDNKDYIVTSTDEQGRVTEFVFNGYTIGAESMVYDVSYGVDDSITIEKPVGIEIRGLRKVFDKDGTLLQTTITELDRSIVIENYYENGSWSKVTTDADGVVIGQEGMRMLAAGGGESGAIFPVEGISVSNPNAEAVQLTYSIDANGNATINGSGLEFSAYEDWSLPILQQKKYIPPQLIAEHSLNNITFVGDNNKIKGSSKDDNIKVVGNNNTVDLGDGDDTININGYGWNVAGGEGDDLVASDIDILVSAPYEEEVVVKNATDTKAGSIKFFNTDGQLAEVEIPIGCFIKRADSGNINIINANNEIVATYDKNGNLVSEYDIVVDAAVGELLSFETNDAQNKTFAINMPDGSVETFKLDTVPGSKVIVSMNPNYGLIFDGNDYSVKDLDDNNDWWQVSGNNITVDTAGGDDVVRVTTNGNATIYTGDGDDYVNAEVKGDLFADLGTGADTLNAVVGGDLDVKSDESVADKISFEAMPEDDEPISYDEFEIDDRYSVLIPSSQNPVSGTLMLDNGDHTYTANVFDENGRLIALKYGCDANGENATSFVRYVYDEDGGRTVYDYDEGGYKEKMVQYDKNNLLVASYSQRAGNGVFSQSEDSKFTYALDTMGTTYMQKKESRITNADGTFWDEVITYSEHGRMLTWSSTSTQDDSIATNYYNYDGSYKTVITDGNGTTVQITEYDVNGTPIS